MSNKRKDFTRKRRQLREIKQSGVQASLVGLSTDEEREVMREEIRRKKQAYRDWHELVDLDDKEYE